MKRFAMILVAAAMLIGGTGVAMAQHHGGGGGMGGGGMHGGGGAWHGGGGSWHGGSWGGHWHGGWGWHGTSVVIGIGGPWWGWWPAYYPYYYGYGYPYYYPYYPYSSPYYSDAPMYDSGGYVQRPDAEYQGDTSQAPTQGGYQYYCPNPAGYYPQVPTCAAGWLRVIPPNAPGPTSPR
jgi:hypothetical protein